MNSVGAILKAERERQGLETSEIAENLCITQRYLRAIEQDDLKNLPGTFFYKSFVKQYAAILAIDEKVLQPGIAELTAAEEPLPLPGADPRYTRQGHSGQASGTRGQTAAQPEWSNPSSSPAAVENGPAAVRELDPLVRASNRRYFPETTIGVTIAGLVAVLLACSGFYAWWNRAPRAAQASGPVAGTASGAFRAASQTADPKNATASMDVTTGPDGVNHVVLHLSATEKTWVSITSDGKQIFSGILEPSQTKTLTGLEVAKMKVGNAGGLEVLWNGKPIGPIGPRGQVRDVLFTPDNFEILSPIRPL